PKISPGRFDKGQLCHFLLRQGQHFPVKKEHNFNNLDRRIWGKINIMTELIIIRTRESEKIKKFLEQERVDYEVYHEEEKPQKISEAELGRAYQEAWSNPQRYQEAQK
ncbi:14438_t:CDS:2, partial [Cetraspora pellucida]